MMRIGFVVAATLVWSVSAQGQNGPVDQPSAPTTEKGQPVAPTGAPRPTVPPGVPASVPTGSIAAETNGPGSAGTSSNPLVHEPMAAPGTAKNGVNPANGVYSATEDKGQSDIHRDSREGENPD